MFNESFIAKAVDYSALQWGITLPVKARKAFKCGKIKRGSHRPITIIWGRKRFKAILAHIHRTAAPNVFQIRYDTNHPLLSLLRKTFAHTHIMTESQRMLKRKGQYRTDPGSHGKEYLKVYPLSAREIVFEPMNIITGVYHHFHQRLIEDNIFDYFLKKKRLQLIRTSKDWMKRSELTHHYNQKWCIYTLLDTRNQLIYVGKADVLGPRIKGDRSASGIPKWNFFRYDAINPEFRDLLERIEEHTYRVVGRLCQSRLQLKGRFSKFKMTNKSIRRA